MVMRMLRRNNLRAERDVQTPRAKEHPSAILTIDVPVGADHAVRDIVFSDEVWRANLVALDIENLESDAQLLVRINDSPPSSKNDLTRGDVRGILPQSYTEIRGPVIEHIGVRVQLQSPRTAEEGTLTARLQMRGWTR